LNVLLYGIAGTGGPLEQHARHRLARTVGLRQKLLHVEIGDVVPDDVTPHPRGRRGPPARRGCPETRRPVRSRLSAGLVDVITERWNSGGTAAQVRIIGDHRVTGRRLLRRSPSCWSRSMHRPGAGVVERGGGVRERRQRALPLRQVGHLAACRYGGWRWNGASFEGVCALGSSVPTG